MIVALGVTLGALAIGHGASGQAGTELSFDVGAPSGCLEVGAGDEIDVTLVITHVGQLQAWEATITHDFGVIRIIAQNAQVLLSGFEASEPLPDTNGQHLLAVGSTQAKSVTGSSVLATIKFEAVGAGVSIIDIPQTDFDNDGDTDFGAVLQIGSTYIGDVNGDNFFDGPVQSARIAVDASCASPTQEPTGPPTPKPETPSPSPTPTPSPVVTSTPTPVGQTPTPTPTLPPATPTGTPVDQELIWGDVDCKDGVKTRDNQALLRYLLDQPPLSGEGDCPDLGDPITVAGNDGIWGDLDCKGDVGTRDNQALLRYVLEQPALSQTQPCPLLGALVQVLG